MARPYEDWLQRPEELAEEFGYPNITDQLTALYQQSNVGTEFAEQTPALSDIGHGYYGVYEEGKSPEDIWPGTTANGYVPQSIQAWEGEEPEHWDEFFNWIHPQTMGGLGAATGYEKGPEWESFASQWDPSQATATSPFWSPGEGRDPTFANQALAWTPSADQQAQFDLFNQMGQAALMSPEGAWAASQEGFDVWDANRIALENLYTQFESTGPGQFAQTARLGGDPGNPQDLWNLQVAEPWNQRIRQLQGEADQGVQCPDGSRAATLADCPPDLNGDLVQCPDGSMAPTLADCPTVGGVTCPDGSTAATLADCPATPDPDLCPVGQVRGADGNCYVPGDDPITTNVPRFNEDPSSAQFTPTDTWPPDWLKPFLTERGDELPMLPTEWEDIFRVEMGTDPLSKMTNKILANLGTTGGVAYTPLAGATEQSLLDTLQERGRAPMTSMQSQIANTLSDIIASGGRQPDDQRAAMEIEAARSPLDILRQSQLAEGQAAMAGRGLLGQGPEVDYGERLEARLAPEYTRAGQLLEIERRDREDARLQGALELGARTAQERELLRTNRLTSALEQATGMSEEQSRNLLDTVRTVNERQQMLNDIAIQSLDRNMEWNKFLAEHGLKRHEVLEAIEQNRFDAILPILQEYLRTVSVSAVGTVPPE